MNIKDICEMGPTVYIPYYVPHMNHVSVSRTNGNGPTQGQRKTLTRVVGFLFILFSLLFFSSQKKSPRFYFPVMLTSPNFLMNGCSETQFDGSKTCPCPVLAFELVSWSIILNVHLHDYSVLS